MSEEKKDKSVLDGIPVEDKAFPLHKGGTSAAGCGKDPQLVIVGHCPQCGGPCYGKMTVFANEKPPIVYSCNCFRKDGIVRQSFVENKEHK